MECDYYKSMYKAIYLHFEKSKRLFLNPIGRLIAPGWDGTVAIPPVIELELPCEKEALVKAMQETFDNCYKLDGNSAPKEGTIENYFGIKSEKKFIQLFDKRLILRLTSDKKYSLMIFKGVLKGRGYYSDPETITFGDSIDYDYLLNLIQ